MKAQVTPDEAGLRLDLFLLRRDPRQSRAFFKRLIDGGTVTVNQQQKKSSSLVRTGEEVCWTIPLAQKGTAQPEEIPLKILYEDDDLLVLDKPAGLVVHPAAGHSSGTLVNALLHHCKNLSVIGGIERPGIVHRLDKGTSGLMVVAKNDQTHLALSLQFKEHQVEKVYTALVQGEILKEQGVIISALGRHSRHRQKISSRTNRGRPSESHFKVKDRFKGYTLVAVRPKTGRTHQIRVHLSESGFPIVSDPLYGGKRLGPLARPFLHASSLSFEQPTRKERMTFESPLPEDLVHAISMLERKVKK
ncbi:MAG: RluA family pseudouridine synthase [Deltaproteobacteria bacterium]|nr:RluA family pseudouridine synthase [Deltaproteobacteria bacterium]